MRLDDMEQFLLDAEAEAEGEGDEDEEGDNQEDDEDDEGEALRAGNGTAGGSRILVSFLPQNFLQNCFCWQDKHDRVSTI